MKMKKVQKYRNRNIDYIQFELDAFKWLHLHFFNGFENELCLLLNGFENEIENEADKNNEISIYNRCCWAS